MKLLDSTAVNSVFKFQNDKFLQTLVYTILQFKNQS